MTPPENERMPKSDDMTTFQINYSVIAVEQVRNETNHLSAFDKN